MAKIAVDIPITLSHKFYKTNYVNPIGVRLYRKVLKAINKKILNLLIKGIVISLPYKLGILYVSRFKPNYRFNKDGTLKIANMAKEVDWYETNKLWKEQPELKAKRYLTHENIHSDGYRMKIEWEQSTNKIGHKLYNFAPSRNFTRGLAKYIKDNKNIDYNDN